MASKAKCSRLTGKDKNLEKTKKIWQLKGNWQLWREAVQMSEETGSQNIKG